MINDRDLAGPILLAHSTLNFDNRHRSTAHLTQNTAYWLRLQSPITGCLIWKVAPKVPLLRSNYLTPPGTKDPITHHQDSWPSGLSDQRLPGAEGPPEENNFPPAPAFFSSSRFLPEHQNISPQFPNYVNDSGA